MVRRSARARSIASRGAAMLTALLVAAGFCWFGADSPTVALADSAQSGGDLSDFAQVSAIGEPARAQGDAVAGIELASDGDALGVDLAVVAQADQSEARALLDMVNAARAAVGAPALAWNTVLEVAALQRAVEIAVCFGHDRPDGSDCFTVFDDLGLTYRKVGENIAVGYPTAEWVNTGWTNSAGHYGNMIDAGFSSMAAACVASLDGTLFWVELFSSEPGDGMATEACDGTVWTRVSVQVPMLEGFYALADEWIEKGWTVSYPLVGQNASGWGEYMFAPGSLVWTSSNPQVVAVDECNLIGLHSGISTITVSDPTATVSYRFDLIVGTGFADVGWQHWAAVGGYIDYVVDNGMMGGYTFEDGTPTGYFGPEDNVTRAQLATVLYRSMVAAGQVADPDRYGREAVFEDVPVGEWYAAAIEWCYENGVITGYQTASGEPTGLFGPNDPVTREQFATMLYRFAALFDKTSDAVPDLGAFPDGGQVSPYAVEAMAWCNANGIITGDLTSGTALLVPWGNASRCQMAKMVTVLMRDVID